MTFTISVQSATLACFLALVLISVNGNILARAGMDIVERIKSQSSFLMTQDQEQCPAFVLFRLLFLAKVLQLQPDWQWSATSTGLAVVCTFFVEMHISCPATKGLWHAGSNETKKTRANLQPSQSARRQFSISHCTTIAGGGFQLKILEV